jgi:MerR family transcriptional regulator/heat shock protein HspR
MNLEGIRRVMQLEAENARLREELSSAKAQARQAQSDAERRQRRDLVPLRQAVAVFGEAPEFLRRRAAEKPDR